MQSTVQFDAATPVLRISPPLPLAAAAEEFGVRREGHLDALERGALGGDALGRLGHCLESCSGGLCAGPKALVSSDVVKMAREP